VKETTRDGIQIAERGDEPEPAMEDALVS
jgi:hypothetical protein